MCLFWNRHFDRGERMILGLSHKQIQALNTVLIQRMHSNQKKKLKMTLSLETAMSRVWTKDLSFLYLLFILKSLEHPFPPFNG